jgi:hypothetical protein
MNHVFKTLHLTFIFYLLALTLAGCKKKEVQDPYQNHMLAQETFDYGYFKVGTYWIYQDSITAAEDCVYVFYNRTQIDTIPENNQYKYDPGLYNWFELDAHSTYYNQDYNYWSNSSWSTEINNYMNIINRVTKIQFETILWTNKFEPGKQAHPSTSYGVVTFINEMLSYAGYQRVVLFNDSKNQTENDSETNFFISRNIGIVRKEILDSNKVWNLVRYNCIQ